MKIPRNFSVWSQSADIFLPICSKIGFILDDKSPLAALYTQRSRNACFENDLDRISHFFDSCWPNVFLFVCYFPILPIENTLTMNEQLIKMWNMYSSIHSNFIWNICQFLMGFFCVFAFAIPHYIFGYTGVWPLRLCEQMFCDGIIQTLFIQVWNSWWWFYFILFCQFMRKHYNSLALISDYLISRNS